METNLCTGIAVADHLFRNFSGGISDSGPSKTTTGRPNQPEHLHFPVAFDCHLTQLNHSFAITLLGLLHLLVDSHFN